MKLVYMFFTGSKLDIKVWVLFVAVVFSFFDEKKLWRRPKVTDSLD